MSSDFFMRQVEGMADMLSVILFGRKSSETTELIVETQTSAQGDSLLTDLRYLTLQGQVNEAENLLFERMETDRNSCYLETARQFFCRLWEYSDEQLASYQYSREEITEGMWAAERFYAGHAANGAQRGG